ncbi:MAG: zinc-ribbon domain-containing protein [Planctomycetota bacterium]
MPLVATCPKCQARYQLKDQFAGRQVQCPKCQHKFVVQATPVPAGAAAAAPGGAAPAQAGMAAQQQAAQQQAAQQQAAQQQAAQQQAAQRAAQQRAMQQQHAAQQKAYKEQLAKQKAEAARKAASAPQPAAAKLKQFGLDGPVGRPADIFSEPTPPGGDPLANHIIQDPGFVLPEQEAAEESPVEQPVDEISAMLENPHIREKVKQRGKVSLMKPSDYGVTRIALQIVYNSWLAVLLPSATTILMFIVLAIGAYFGAILIPPPILLIILLVVYGLTMMGLLGVFVGQCMCCAAPNRNEKLFAWLSIGAFVGGFGLMITGLVFSLTGDLLSQVVGGLMILVGYLIPATSPMFFTFFCRSIGQNINSRAVTSAAKDSLIAQIAFVVSIFVYIGLIIGLGILFGAFDQVQAEDSTGVSLETHQNIILFAINAVFLMISVYGIYTYLSMMNTTIDKLKA